MFGSWVELYGCVIERITERAVFVKYEGFGYWLPKSQVHNADDLKSGPEPTHISVTRWIAEQKGIVRC